MTSAPIAAATTSFKTWTSGENTGSPALSTPEMRSKAALPDMRSPSLRRGNRKNTVGGADYITAAARDGG